MAYNFRKLFSEFKPGPSLDPGEAFELKSLSNQMPSLIQADHPLAFGDAQNTAQKSNDKSDELQEALKAAQQFVGGFEKNPMYNPSATGINAPSMFKPTQGKYAPNRRVFAGSYYNTDPYGNLKDESYEMARNGFMSIMGGGKSMGFDRVDKTANKGNLPIPFTGEGNLPSRYETFHSIEGVKGQSVKDYLSSRNINPIKETPEPKGFSIPDDYKGIMAPLKTQ
jgi:hypothetical protein